MVVFIMLHLILESKLLPIFFIYILIPEGCHMIPILFFLRYQL